MIDDLLEVREEQDTAIGSDNNSVSTNCKEIYCSLTPVL